MITLIGGPPRCGKTTIARAWALEAGSSFLPADYLTTAISGYLDEVHAQRLLPRLPGTFRDNDTKYANFTLDQIIGNYRTKAASTWSAIRDVVEYALDDGNPFVVEGYQVEPIAVADLISGTAPRNLTSLFAYRTDVDQTVGALHHQTRNDWATAFTKRDTTFRAIAEMICEYGAIVASEATSVGLPTINMDGDFAERVQVALGTASCAQWDDSRPSDGTSS